MRNPVRVWRRWKYDRLLAKWRREREAREADDVEAWGVSFDWSAPQTLRLARRGDIGEGDLYVGRISDVLSQFRDGLVIHLGHENPQENLETTNNVVVERCVLSDGEGNTVKDWMRWMALVKLGSECIRRNIKVVCVCDAGISRSVSTASAIVAYHQEIPMTMLLSRELRNRTWDHGFGEVLPNPKLFSGAQVALEVLRNFVREPANGDEATEES